MGLFDDFGNPERKRQTILNLAKAQSALWECLVDLKIDPDTFNPDEWGEPEDMGGSPRGRVAYYIGVINHAQGILAQLPDE